MVEAFVDAKMERADISLRSTGSRPTWAARGSRRTKSRNCGLRARRAVTRYLIRSSPKFQVTTFSHKIAWRSPSGSNGRRIETGLFAKL